MLLRACDIDKKVPAKNYTLTADDGRSISKDLCAEHAEPFEEWLEEASLAEEVEPINAAEWLETGEGSLVEPATEPEPAERAAPRKAVTRKAPAAKKAATKKAATKKAATKKAAPARKRPKIMSLEEIEAQKKQS
ncbi:hypothetical protein [Streptomyces collinus]|uniref:hypothetical protein n=1 Tax=Streptomyces collinus TaxID=42684 RepID=UPI0037B069A5